MGLLTFKGGLHPYDGKELSKEGQGTDCCVSSKRGTGLSFESAYRRAGRSLCGKGRPGAGWSENCGCGGFVSANIHSSVSGTVKAIEPRVTVSGAKVSCIVVENDGQYEQAEFVPVTERTPEAIIGAVKEAGIVGLGGAGFPTHVKLSPKERTRLIPSSSTARSVSHISRPITAV